MLNWMHFIFNICPLTMISRHVLNNTKLEVFIARRPPATHFGLDAVLWSGRTMSALKTLRSKHVVVRGIQHSLFEVSVCSLLNLWIIFPL